MLLQISLSLVRQQLVQTLSVYSRSLPVGVAVYFMSPLWPYGVFTQLQLDSQPPVELNLSDPNVRTPDATGPETVESAVVWGSGPLSNTTHTLLISKIRRPDRPYAIVDGLM